MRRGGTIAAALGMALLLAGCAAKPALPPAALVEVPLDREAALAAVNRYRGENGVGALAIDDRLMRAAAWQSGAMARAARMSHDVSGPLPARVEKFGYRWGTVAENIAENYPDHDAALAAWIRSPGHRRNLLDPRVTAIGFAAERRAAGGPLFWTQVFASPSRTVSAPATTATNPYRWGPGLRFP